jgi:S-disulfanyl-L-cysteine oxidoreductase SoxD
MLMPGLVQAEQAPPLRFDLGRVATVAEVAEMDIDVRPDGAGLPAGSGNAALGEKLFQGKCQSCHGVGGRGGPFDTLVGRLPDDDFPFGRDPSVKKTIGNYWPYATTLFDYTLRAMPYDAPGSLSVDEVYSLTAFLLHENKIIDDTTELNQDNLAAIKMPSRDRFVLDDRLGGDEIR